MRHMKMFEKPLPIRLKEALKPIYYSTVFGWIYGLFEPLIAKLAVKLKLKGKSVSTKENFLKLHLGCGNKYFPGYININRRKTEATDYICDITDISLPNNSVELIETYHMIENFSPKVFSKALKNWWKKLIPGGELIIECSDSDNCSRFDGVLKKHGYCNVKRCVPQDYRRPKEPCMRIAACKRIGKLDLYDIEKKWRDRKRLKPETLKLSWRENQIHAKILKELEEDIFSGKKIISLGCGSGELEIIMGEREHSITGVDISKTAVCIAENHKRKEKVDNIHFVRASLKHLPFLTNSFDAGYMIESLEYIDPENVKSVFKEIQRVLKPEAKLLIVVPNKNAYRDPNYAQFFTKARLARLIDEMNLSIEWMDSEERKDKYQKHDMLKTMVSNRPAFQATKKRKICAIGAYDTRGYTDLGFHWDGQARAFKELGYKTLLLDIRMDNNYQNLRAKILDFHPDILLLGLENSLPFIKWMEGDIKKLRREGCKVVYWFLDLREPKPMNLGDLIDVMFLSNAGQLEDYRKSYGLDRVYYMPHACTPQFMHQVINVEKMYDIAFTGSMDLSKFHRRRTQLIRKLSKKYKIEVRNDVFNNIADFYSRSKIVFGWDLDFSKKYNIEKYYLYASGRFYTALGCGAFYLCEWFPGIEKLVKNRKHVVWFKTENELFELIDYYLRNPKEREKIGKNAQKLAHSKHAYTARIQNMIDIIDGKTEEFYGFL